MEATRKESREYSDKIIEFWKWGINPITGWKVLRQEQEQQRIEKKSRAL